jgi:hypothetical protein
LFIEEVGIGFYHFQHPFDFRIGILAGNTEKKRREKAQSSCFSQETIYSHHGQISLFIEDFPLTLRGSNQRYLVGHPAQSG